MCLILLAWRTAAARPLVVAANRDEFHGRPAARAAFWADAPDLLAGRDLEAGGTWMGVSREGRFAAVTNYRGGRAAAAAESRGALVARFLHSRESASRYAAGLTRRLDAYSGFNLLLCDGDELWWVSNRDGGSRHLEPGIYGLGNLLLDSPDVEAHKACFARVVAGVPEAVPAEPLFGVLEQAKLVAPQYGTRCATVLTEDGGGGLRYAERAFDASGAPASTCRYEFRKRA